VLLEELKKGELGLPEIQRSYVWNRPQARDLVDSLYREYPSGLILLWKPEQLPVLREASQSQTRQPDFLILDGQQRLISLQKIFDGEVDVWFNAEEESFEIYSPKMKANPLWVSVQEVMAKGAVASWRELKNRLVKFSRNVQEDETDAYLEKLSKLEKIRDYRYPVMIIHTDDYEEVTESFIRINSRGTKLREAELAMAQFAFHWPGVVIKQFEEALDTYEQANFDLEARFLMRCYVAVGTGQSRFRYLGSLWSKDQNELGEIWKQTRRGLDYTINFLKNNAGVESSDWVPSINALVPLVAYFSKKEGQLSPTEEKTLLFWLFEATIHGRFTGSPETKLDQDLRALNSSADGLGQLIANLRREVPDFGVTTEMLVGRYQRHSFLPLLFAVFRERSARDWFTGVVLSSTNVGPEHRLEFHHIFPKALLRNRYTSYEIDDLANIALLSQIAHRPIGKSEPRLYLPSIEQSRLTAQLVPLDEDLLRVERYKDFLSVRRELVSRAMNDYLRDLGREWFQKNPPTA